jgi:hypothetical protein
MINPASVTIASGKRRKGAYERTVAPPRKNAKKSEVRCEERRVASEADDRLDADL